MSATIHQEDGYVVLKIVPDVTRLTAALEKATAALARLAARQEAHEALRYLLNKRRSEMRSAYRKRQRSRHRSRR